jgi:hypothetical protein
LLNEAWGGSVMKDERFKKYTIKAAKELDLVSYLSGIGFNYVDRFSRGKHYCYISPFRLDERTPSFKIEKGTNHWVDYGTADGITHGNIIDFGIAFFKCTVKEFLAELSGNMSLPQIIVQRQATPPKKQKEEVLKIEFVRPLTSASLLAYIEKRGISKALAQTWCKEVDYLLYTRMHTGIGFKNDQGGYDLRNAVDKHSSIPKTYRTIAASGAKTISVFEGFMDFLSYLSLPAFRAREPSAYLVLNSTTSFEKAVQVLEQYPCVKLYLDQDATGRKCTQQALGRGSKYHDESGLYAGHKDLNEYLVNLKQTVKNELKPRL